MNGLIFMISTYNLKLLCSFTAQVICEVPDMNNVLLTNYDEQKRESCKILCGIGTLLNFMNYTRCAEKSIKHLCTAVEDLFVLS